MKQYASLHANHVHQLMVSVSKHYYATHSNMLKYQQKPFDVTLANVGTKTKKYMITQVIRDHTSGVFYTEVSFGPMLPDIYGFLQRAWQTKSYTPFHGLPLLMTIPETVERAYPDLSKCIADLNIELVPVSSGFQGGIRDLHTIESYLIMATDHPISLAIDHIHNAMQYNANSKGRAGNETKREMWLRSLPPVKLLPSPWPTV